MTVFIKIVISNHQTTVCHFPCGISKWPLVKFQRMTFPPCLVLHQLLIVHFLFKNYSAVWVVGIATCLWMTIFTSLLRVDVILVDIFLVTGATEGQVSQKTWKLVRLSVQNLLDCAKPQSSSSSSTNYALQYVKDNGGLRKMYPFETKVSRMSKLSSQSLLGKGTTSEIINCL